MHILMIESNPAGISGIKRAIEAGFEVTLMTVDPNFYLNTNLDTEEVFKNPSFHLVHDVNIFNMDSLMRCVDDLNSLHKIDGVTTYSEYHVVHAAEVARYLKLPGMNVEGAKNARFKHRTREKLKSTTVSQPKFAHANNEDELSAAIKEIGFPCVIKTSDGTAGLNVVFIKNEEEYKNYLSKINQIVDYGRGVLRTKFLLVEEYIAGNLVSVESCVLSKNHIVNMGITDRILGGFPSFIEMGCTYFNDHPLRDELFSLNTQVLNELDIDFGFIHTEFLLSENGPVLCEVNGRLVGGAVPQLMKISSGVDPFIEVIHLALGLKVNFSFPGNKIACSRWFGSTVAGKLNKISFGKLNQLPGFVEAVCYKKIGEKVSPLLHSNFDWLGHFILSGDSRDSIVEQAEIAINEISLDLSVEVAR